MTPGRRARPCAPWRCRRASRRLDGSLKSSVPAMVPPVSSAVERVQGIEDALAGEVLVLARLGQRGVSDLRAGVGIQRAVRGRRPLGVPAGRRRGTSAHRRLHGERRHRGDDVVVRLQRLRGRRGQQLRRPAWAVGDDRDVELLRRGHTRQRGGLRRSRREQDRLHAGARKAATWPVMSVSAGVIFCSTILRSCLEAANFEPFSAFSP